MNELKPCSFKFTYQKPKEETEETERWEVDE